MTFGCLLALGVSGEDVGFDVDGVAGLEGVEAGGLVGVGDDGDLDFGAVRVGRRRATVREMPSMVMEPCWTT